MKDSEKELSEVLNELLKEVRKLNSNMENFGNYQSYEKSISEKIGKLTTIMTFLTGAVYLLTGLLVGLEILNMVHNQTISHSLGVMYIIFTFMGIVVVAYIIKRVS